MHSTLSDASLKKTLDSQATPSEPANASDEVLVKTEHFDSTESPLSPSRLKRKLESCGIAEPPPSNVNTETPLVEASKESSSSSSPVAASAEQLYLSEDLDERSKQALLQNTTEQLKKKICILKLKHLNEIRQECVDNLSEQFYLDKNLNYADYAKWKSEAANNSENSLKLSEYVQKRFVNNGGDLFNLEKSLASKFKCSLPLIEPTPPQQLLKVNNASLNYSCKSLMQKA